MRIGFTVVLLLAGLAAGVWWAWRDDEHRFDGPIRIIARQYSLAPGLVKAVVWRESAFNARARGGKEELGLMQLQPTTAQEWADSRRDAGFKPEHLLNPVTNLHAGCYYLAKLVRRYPRADNPWAYALADYNAGRGNVLKWLKGPAETNSAAFVAGIPFPTTQDYVRKILARAPGYQAELQ